MVSEKEWKLWAVVKFSKEDVLEAERNCLHNIIKIGRASGLFFQCGQVFIWMQKKINSFKKINRLKSKKSFQVVYSKGRTVVDGMSVFYILPEQAEDIKIGMAVGKKLGCAVVRNRMKRLMREVFRVHKQRIKKGYHIVWVARRKLAKADIKTFERVFLRLAKRAALLQE